MIDISVIIPVYNSQQYIAQCLDSVLMQQGPAFEIICVDDGSTDRSPAILAEYAVRDSRVRVLRQQNQYAGVARNRGMAVAQGAYLAFLDADDYYLPGALAVLHRLAQRHKLDMVKGRFFLQDVQTGAQSRTFFSRSSGVPCHRVLNFQSCPDRLLSGADVPWNGLYRRSFVERENIRFNRLRCINDHSFYIHCLLKADRLMFVRREVTCYRVAQFESLIGQKAWCFQSQLDNYAIVRALCAREAPAMLQTVLRRELIGLLDWYTRLRSATPDPTLLDGQVRGFLQKYNEADVGEDFLRDFPYRLVYYRLRYDTEPPNRRLGALARLVRCQQEHGWLYTLARVYARFAGGKQ